MQDVANKAGVSKSTVSQFINKRYEYMSEKTKLKIAQSIEELGYIPNSIARSLTQRKTYTIGVIVANIIHSFSNEIIRSIEDVCEEAGVQVFVCNADDKPDKEKKYMEQLIAKQVDGLIIFPTGGNLEYYKDLKKSKFPIVFIDRKIDPSIYPTFMLHNEKAIQSAVDILLDKHKEIGVISTSIETEVTPRIERINSFRNIIQKKQLPLNEDWIISQSVEEIKRRLELLLKNNNLPEAFLATNDLSVIELLKFLKKNNIAIPDDIGVITIDDSPYLEVSMTPISVIKQPTFKMGKDAAKKLLELIEKGVSKDTYEITRYIPAIIERESV